VTARAEPSDGEVEVVHAHLCQGLLPAEGLRILALEGARLSNETSEAQTRRMAKRLIKCIAMYVVESLVSDVPLNFLSSFLGHFLEHHSVNIALGLGKTHFESLPCILG
jgi:hypothetical protein